MDDLSKESDDFSRVVQSLANGLRSETEIAAGSRLPPDKQRSALDRLIADGFVCESLGTMGALFRLSDKGNDMLKGIDARARKDSSGQL